VIVAATKIKYFVPTQLSLRFKLQSKVVEQVNASLSSFYIVFYIYIIELVLIQNITEVLLMDF
jgi:hypothetical protein